MELLSTKINQIIQGLNRPGSTQHTGYKDICYLTFPFDAIIEVKRNTKTLVSLLKHHDYEVSILSIGELVNDFIKNNPRRDKWIEFSVVEYKDEMTDFFKSIGSAIITNEIIEKAILQKQGQIKNHVKPLLLLTDLEGIHPFTRFGPVEQNIYNQIEIPIVILYPGELSGSSLEFLGFYPPDGNYRSKHY